MFRIGKEEIAAVERVIESKKLFRDGSTYREVENFEIEWAERIGTKYSVLVNGGTAALICGLVGLGIGPGDEVIIPGYTFMATALAVVAVGAIPVIVDIDDSLTIDPDDIERKISAYTRVIIPVDLVGFPCDMDRIITIARKYNLKVLEDACQANGGSYKGRRLGSIGDAGAFSFNYFKIIGAGEGGSLVTSNREIYERAMIHHDGGIAFRASAKEMQVPIFTGSQFRVSEITGAIMRVQLQRLEEILADLRRVKKVFMERLSSVPGVRFVRSNDIEGDCGSTLGFYFDDEAKARAFAESEDVGAWLPIDSGKHVYSNWDPILSKRGAAHPDMNPFNFPQNKNLNMNYSKDMCKTTLEILKRAAFISINPDWTEEEIDQRIEACRRGVKKL